MVVLLATIWFVWEIKYVLFWLYLWQLKDYHVGRFVDHFRTDKGKKIIFNYIQIIKLGLFILLLKPGIFFEKLVYVLVLIYIVQAVVFAVSFIRRTIRKPKTTLKIAFLNTISFASVILFLIWSLTFDETALPLFILGFDVLTPIMISIIVLLFQPFFVLLRNFTLRKAKNKMGKIKSVSGLKVIAITGSYGKTTTKEFLSTILSKKYKVLKTNEHQNSEIGIAKCILKELKPSHQVFVVEIGAYNKGKVKEVCSMVNPKIGMVTGVNEQHLALFGSLENLLSSEGGRELADSLPKDGLLAVNGDNKYCVDLYKKSLKPDFNRKRIYSLSNKTLDSNIWADSIEVFKDRISFIAMSKSGEMAHFDVKVLGKQNVQNLLGAILIARELGMTFGEISDACKNISQAQGGMVLIKGKHGIDIINSSYSANPDGVVADLNYFHVFMGKRVIVMPCLIELGKKSSEIHRKLGSEIAKICDFAIITTKDRFEDIRNGATEAGMREDDILLCDNAKDIYSLITLSCKQGDAVLLEGRVPARLIELLKD